MEFDLSARACAVLDKHEEQGYEVGKFILYRTEAVPEDVITKLCSEALFYNIVAESEVEAEVFVPVLPCHGQRDVQAAFDKHMQNMAKLSTERDESTWHGWDVWPFGLVIADEPERPLVILMSKDRGRWRISHCRIPFKELDHLGRIIYDASYEDWVIEEFDGVLGTGGPPPDWKYQFALFSTGMDYPNTIKRQIDPDSSSYALEEYALSLKTKYENINHRVSWEEAVEMFPGTCRRLVYFDGEPSPVQCHPHLFLCIDTPTPEKDGVLVCEISWDGNTDRSEDELKAIGRTSKVTKTRRQVDVALKTIRRMADDLDEASKA